MSFDNYFIKGIKDKILIIILLFIIGLASTYYLINNLTESSEYYQLQITNNKYNEHSFS